MTTEPEVREFGTLQLRTRIEPVASGWFRWTRSRLAGRLGPPTPDNFPGPDATPHLLVGTRCGQDTGYLCRGDRSLAQMVWPPGRFALPPQSAAAAVRATGLVLSGIAAHPTADFGTLPPPPALGRLDDWLSRREGPEEAARLYDLSRSLLGPHRLHELRGWIGDLTEPGGRHVLLHGEPSLGLVVLPRSGSWAPVLLTGESFSQGPAEFDPGWMLGELAEMTDIARRNLPEQETRALLSGMAAALYETCGLLDATVLGRVVTLRRLVHLLDFATYVSWTPGVEPSLRRLADLIDEEGAPALADLAVPVSPEPWCAGSEMREQ